MEFGQEYAYQEESENTQEVAEPVEDMQKEEVEALAFNEGEYRDWETWV